MKTKIVAMLIALLMLSAVFVPMVSAVENREIKEGAVLEKIQNLAGVDKNNIRTKFVSESMADRKELIFHIKFPLFRDESGLPVKVDVWVDMKNLKRPKIDYLAPGSGINADANFGTNPVKTFVEDRMEKGYSIVVGINPPEASYDPKNPAHSEKMLENLGLSNHTKNVKKVIELFQKAGLDYDYAIEGHSAGALVAAVVAAETGNSDPHFKEVGIYDMALQFKPESIQAEYAAISHSAVANLFESGVYKYSSFEDYKAMADTIRAYPGVYIDSGVPRELFAPGFSGNFSVEGLFYFASIHTGWMPGPVSGVTGLPDSWYFGNGGYISGNYQFMSDPADDVYGFSLTKEETMFEALDKIKYGAYPTAFERDIMAVLAGIYLVNWDNISNQVKISWKNAECGIGDIIQIDRAYEILSGRPGFSYNVRPGFCHADITFADCAFE